MLRHDYVPSKEGLSPVIAEIEMLKKNFIVKLLRYVPNTEGFSPMITEI